VLDQQPVLGVQTGRTRAGSGQQDLVEFADLSPQVGLADPPQQPFGQNGVLATLGLDQSKALLGLRQLDVLGHDVQVVIVDDEVQRQGDVDRPLPFDLEPGVLAARHAGADLALDPADPQIGFEDAHSDPGLSVLAQRQHRLGEVRAVVQVVDAAGDLAPGSGKSPRSIDAKALGEDVIQVLFGDIEQHGIGHVECGRPRVRGGDCVGDQPDDQREESRTPFLAEAWSQTA
jgi:hypothetical protein